MRNNDFTINQPFDESFIFLSLYLVSFFYNCRDYETNRAKHFFYSNNKKRNSTWYCSYLEEIFLLFFDFDRVLIII